MRKEKTMEIERKFILKAFPGNLEEETRHTIFQYYLSCDPYVRVRSKLKDGETTYKLTIKGKGTLSRVEVEFDMDSESFSELISLCEYEPVRKDMRIYRLPDGKIFECSNVDKGTENEFFYGEVEFEDENSALSFSPPFSFLREVTYDDSFHMNRYWQTTRIDGKSFKI